MYKPKKTHGRKSTRRREKQTKPSTPRQTQILTFVRDYVHKNGYSPTYDEIAAEFGISKVTVFEHLTILEERGLITLDKHKARSLHLANHLQLPDEKPSCIPLLGRIAAGGPMEAIEDARTLDLEDVFHSSHDTFALEV